MSGFVVVEGASIQCILGTIPTPLSLNLCRILQVAGKSVCIITDHQPAVNIKPFGICRITGLPCSPLTPFPWTNDINVQLGDSLSLPLLTQSSVLQCTVGGVIHILNPGQTTVIIGSSGQLTTLSILEQILKNYQVQDDELTATVNALGFVPLDVPTITKTEANMLSRLNPLGLMRFKNIHDQAFETSNEQFPAPDNIPIYVPDDNTNQEMWLNNDGHRDAFRHAYWNSLLTREFGLNWTEQYATAHEAIPGNVAVREAMDLYNNEVGRQIAIANPNASDQEIINLVQQAVDNGELVVVDQDGNLAWSDQVPLWEHGFADETEGIGGQPVPDGNASAE